jgi:hypothetical protein
MAQRPKTPMPKKWIILVTIVIVVAIVGVLIMSYKPPELTMDIKSMTWINDGEDLNLTLTFSTKDINVTSSEYRVKVTVRRTVGDAETKEQVLDQPLAPVPPQSSEDQVFTLPGVSGFSDMNIQILKSGKQVIFRTQRLPIA